MNVLILGADGYLGWPTAMDLASKGHRVMAVDNYLRRTIAMETDSQALFPNPLLPQRVGIFAASTEMQIDVRIGDCCDYDFLAETVRDFVPDAVIHYAEQPSAPYSMIDQRAAHRTVSNNLLATLNLIWAVKSFAPDCHIVKLGTMGEYGTPNIDIEEGWIDIEHNGRSDRFLYPRQAGSLYHTTKIMDTDLLWFYVRMHGLRVTDLMQGPVYGLVTGQTGVDERLYPNFHYDDIFGTVLNRFIVQAVAGVPLTVYGKGGQTRGYLNLKDTLQCVDLAISNPAATGELRVFNQFIEQFTVTELAERVVAAARVLGIDAQIKAVENPRVEKEEHYYNAKHHGLVELGLQPHHLSEAVLCEMFEAVLPHRASIDQGRIMPRVRW